MTIPKELTKRLARKLLTAGMTLCFTVPAFAVTVPITAEFKPDRANPSANYFKNTTPITGICAHIQYSAFCRSRNLFSINTPILFNSTGPISAKHTNPRMGAMIQVRSGWRDLEVVPVGGGKSETLSFRISGISSTYKTTTPVAELVGVAPNDPKAHRLLWTGGNWDSAPRPCLTTGAQAVPWPSQFLFFWLIPVDGLCAKNANFDIPELQYYAFEFAYELRTPNPLEMATGTYTGSLTVSLGPSADIDMGDIMLPDDNTIELKFNLRVEHLLKVDVPPGGHRVQLEPQGGWQAWLNQGRRPTRLFRDQTFNISTSTQFKMRMECEYTLDGKTCSIREPVSGHTVPLKVSVSLPHGLTDAGGQTVSRRQLLLDGSGTELFQPGFYVDSKPGTLHFEIPPDEVAEMIRPDAPRQYSGNVTVIWDSEI